MGHKITTSTEKKVNAIVNGREGHTVTLVPGCAVVLILIALIMLGILIANGLSNLPAGVLLFNLFGV